MKIKTFWTGGTILPFDEYSHTLTVIYEEAQHDPRTD